MSLGSGLNLVTIPREHECKPQCKSILALPLANFDAILPSNSPGFIGAERLQSHIINKHLCTILFLVKEAVGYAIVVSTCSCSFSNFERAIFFFCFGTF
jgi:hypothetical protein